MKKRILFSYFFLVFSMLSYGHNDSLLVNKTGKPILPQKGDFAIGISANPLFNYVGNMLSNNGLNGMKMSLLDNGVLYGKYFLSSSSAVRLKFSLITNSDVVTNFVTNDNEPLAKVEDVLRKNLTELQITPGFEKRNGKNRLQVSYGGELIFGLSKKKDTYSYGNQLSNNNSNPTTTINFDYFYVTRPNIRPVENKQFTSFTSGIRGFVGVEYFILPKVSLGSEIGLKFLHKTVGKQVVKKEYWDFIDEVPVTNDLVTKKQSSSAINTDILNGQVFILFHF